MTQKKRPRMALPDNPEGDAQAKGAGDIGALRRKVRQIRAGIDNGGRAAKVWKPLLASGQDMKRSPRKTKFGTLLRRVRERKGLSLRDVEAATGLLNGGISHLENGRSVPSLTTAIILCRYYGLPLKKLAAAVAEDEL